MADTSDVPKPGLGDRMKQLFAEYGPVAITIYFVIFGLVFAGAAVAIQMGFSLEGASGTAGTLAAAWVATKVTQPIRILATLALTPIVGGVLRRRRG